MITIIVIIFIIAIINIHYLLQVRIVKTYLYLSINPSFINLPKTFV